MKLRDLFEDVPSDTFTLVDRMRQQVMDFLTPMVARNEHEISLDDIASVLGQYRNGLAIDRDLLMTVLDPDKIKLIKKVQGDTVYLQAPVDEISANTQNDRQKNIDNIKKKAQQQAKKSLRP